MIARHHPVRARSIVDFFQQIPVGPLYGSVAFGLVMAVFLEPGDWRLLIVGLVSLCFTTATAVLTLREWPAAMAVLGLGLASMQQAVALVGISLAGLLGHMKEIGTYSIMLGNEFWVLLLLCLVSLATLLALAVRRMVLPKKQPAVAYKMREEVASDSRFEFILLAGAVFTLLFWVGGLLNIGLVKAGLQTLQRAFMFVPFLAGFYFRVSRRITIVWILTVLANLVLGIITGSRGPAFLPLALFTMGALMGASARQRWYLLGLIVVLAIPGSYVFGMIESIRNSVGRLQISEITVGKIAEVASQLKSGKEESRDAYNQLPLWVTANYRLLTWPTVVVAASTGGQGPYRGFDDLSQQIVASLNVVALTGEMNSYYNEGLYNLRAADYGFMVNTETSVEFGFLAEAWDRGGPITAFFYALTAIVVLALLEAGVRYTLDNQPALRTVAVSVIFTTAFWTMNIYNLPLSLRQIPVNLIICYLFFGAICLFAPKPRERLKRTRRVLISRQ
jgi:hypothetical protein